MFMPGIQEISELQELLLPLEHAPPPANPHSRAEEGVEKNDVMAFCFRSHESVAVWILISHLKKGFGSSNFGFRE